MVWPVPPPNRFAGKTVAGRLHVARQCHSQDVPPARLAAMADETSSSAPGPRCAKPVSRQESRNCRHRTLLADPSERANVIQKIWRRERDSNPRSRSRGITVFKTAAFNHSAIPPRFFVNYDSRKTAWQAGCQVNGERIIGTAVAKKRSHRVVEINDTLAAWLSLLAKTKGPVVPMDSNRTLYARLAQL
jgi:hypothetical protein